MLIKKTVIATNKGLLQRCKQ